MAWTDPAKTRETTSDAPTHQAIAVDEPEATLQQQVLPRVEELVQHGDPQPLRALELWPLGARGGELVREHALERLERGGSAA
jgi:hypothetical protein